MRLPGWAKEVPEGIECYRCGATGQSLPIDHKATCIYNNSLVADGGSEYGGKQRFVEEHGISSWWWEKANQNLDKWGWQDPETLLLATQEELGELTRAYLEYEHERGKRTELEDELDDLAALCYQLYWVLVQGYPEREGSPSKNTNGGVRGE